MPSQIADMTSFLPNFFDVDVFLLSNLVTGPSLMTACSYHATYAFRSKSTLYSCLNAKELLARNRCEIWSLSDCNWT